MGQKKKRLDRFLSDHPVCCFCGGETPATTQDHLPPRSVFVGRVWPEGYAFPACLSCNAGSADEDAIFAMVTRLDPSSPKSPESAAESLRLLSAFMERHPHIARQMPLRANEVRRWLDRHNIAKPNGVAAGELPIMRVPTAMADAVQAVNRKLVLALHYKQTGKIVPKVAEVETRWWTNANRIAGQFPSEAFGFLSREPSLQRGNVSLKDQCSYRYEISSDGSLGAYLIAFRRAIVVAGFVVIGRSERFLAKALTDEASDRLDSTAK